MKNEEYTNNEILRQLDDMKINDVEGFINLILKCFREDMEYVINDTTPVMEKTIALNAMLKYLESIERYEDCSFVKSMITKIENKAKSNEQ